MLRMVGSNSGDFVCTQVLHNLWKLFLCKKCSQSGGGGTSTTTSTRPNSQEVTSNIHHHQTNSELDEEDELDEDDNRQKKKKPDSNETTSGVKSRFLFKKQQQQQQKTSKMPQPQLKSMMIKNRKKQSLIGRLFSDVVTSKSSSLSPVKSSSASNNGVSGKSRSINLMQQQRQRMSSQHQLQARDERFSIEMKRFQSIKRIAHSENRRNMNTMGVEQQQNDD